MFGILSSVTRFGKISPLWQKITSLWQILSGLFLFWQNAEPPLADLWHYWTNFPCCKWPNIEKYSNNLVTLVLRDEEREVNLQNSFAQIVFLKACILFVLTHTHTNTRHDTQLKATIALVQISFNRVLQEYLQLNNILILAFSDWALHTKLLLETFRMEFHFEMKLLLCQKYERLFILQWDCSPYTMSSAIRHL